MNRGCRCRGVGDMGSENHTLMIAHSKDRMMHQNPMHYSVVDSQICWKFGSRF